MSHASNIPFGAEDFALAPWNEPFLRYETIEVFTCASEAGDCDNEVDHEGEVCAACRKYMEEHS